MTDYRHPKTQDKIEKKAKENKTSATSFSQDLYAKHGSAIALLMGHFMLRHLNLCYKEFEGDLVVPIVLGEIAHHNIFRFYSFKGQCIDINTLLINDNSWHDRLEPCNAFSISEATGIPRETVRRKIDKLVKKGWLLKNSNGEVTISNTVGDHFIPNFNRTLLTELLDVSDCINALLEPGRSTA